MQRKVSLSLLVLLGAAASSAQDSPVSKTGEARRNLVEFGAVREAFGSSAFSSDYKGYYHRARLYVSDGWFLALEHFDVEADIAIISPIALIDFLGFGAGYTWNLGSGRLTLGLVHGELSQELPGFAEISADQMRYRLTYELEVAANLTLTASLCHYDTDAVLAADDSLTTGVIGLGYAFGNGLSFQAQYSPDAAIVGVDDPEAEGSYTLGVRFEF